MKLFFVLAIGVALGAGGAFLAPRVLDHAAPYAGQQTRPIASLSAADVEALRKGAGWGLAKPAELNGYPGPLHVIELADELSLRDGQAARIRDSFARMRAAAIQAGEALIDAERALDQGFSEGDIDAARLRALLDRASEARARLREVHLAAHLEITPLLDAEQRELYAALRGYGEGDHSHGGH